MPNNFVCTFTRDVFHLVENVQRPLPSQGLALIEERNGVVRMVYNDCQNYDNRTHGGLYKAQETVTFFTEREEFIIYIMYSILELQSTVLQLDLLFTVLTNINWLCIHYTQQSNLVRFFKHPTQMATYSVMQN